MKKLFKKSLAVILTALMLMSTVPITVSAAEATVGSVGPRSGYTGDCTWILDDEGTLTISGNGEMRDYESDGSYYSYAPWSYTELHCSKVIIEDGVTYIGNCAFAYCDDLTSITIPDSVTNIGEMAFYNCKNLTEIIIPNSVATIGSWSFTGCEKLESATLSNALTEISESTFHGCTSLSEITIPNSVTKIKEKAFLFCTSLKSITIPSSVTSIEYMAFDSCRSMTDAIIPESVISFGDWAFFNCPNLTIYGKVGSHAETYAKKDSIPFEDLDSLSETIASGTTGDCTWELDDKGTLTISGNGAMADYSSYSNVPWKDYEINEVVIENGVTSIGNSAFYRCTKLTGITIPDSVTSIGSYAFISCYSLTSIRIQ